MGHLATLAVQLDTICYDALEAERTGFDDALRLSIGHYNRQVEQAVVEIHSVLERIA